MSLLVTCGFRTTRRSEGRIRSEFHLRVHRDPACRLKAENEVCAVHHGAHHLPTVRDLQGGEDSGQQPGSS